MKPKQIYHVKCGNCRKFTNPENSNIFDKMLALPIIWSKCGKNNDRILTEEQSIEMLKIIGLI